jgi:(+)-trans-carveol dehydrogenase
VGKLDGKVAFITGAARGQGRSHAVRLAQEGADVIAVDLCAQIDTVAYPMATPEDLQQTVKEVEALDRRIVATQADVRDPAAMRAAIEEGVAQLGRLDIVLANAGIASFAPAEEMGDRMWEDMIAINLTGVFYSIRPAIPHLKAAGGGSIVITSSTAGLMGMANLAHYVSAKHGVVGMTRALAIELAPHMIRVNSVHPTTVATDMVFNQGTFDLFRPDLAPGTATRDDAAESFLELNLLPVKWTDPVDISNAVLWLCSDEARYVTGVQLPVDAGSLLK